MYPKNDYNINKKQTNKKLQTKITPMPPFTHTHMCMCTHTHIPIYEKSPADMEKKRKWKSIANLKNIALADCCLNNTILWLVSNGAGTYKCMKTGGMVEQWNCLTHSPSMQTFIRISSYYFYSDGRWCPHVVGMMDRLLHVGTGISYCSLTTCYTGLKRTTYLCWSFICF